MSACGTAMNDTNTTRHSLKAVLLLTVLLGVLVFAALSDVSKTKAMTLVEHLEHDGSTKLKKVDATHNPQQQQQQQQQQCMIHVSGFHHSGTGFLRMQVVEALGGDGFVSFHSKTGVSQDEGQHLQTVYPSHKYRFPDLAPCNLTRGSPSIGRSYFCPNMLDIEKTNPGAKDDLFWQWAKFWNISKPYLVQKTPTFDILFLEQMKVLPTTHAIVMRYPFQWYKQTVKEWETEELHKETIYLHTWLETWTYVLEQLHDGRVDSYVVVNFEALVDNGDQVRHEMSSIIKKECDEGGILNQGGIQAGPAAQYTNPRPNRSRKLHLHTGEESSSYLSLTNGALRLQNKCLVTADCHSLMDALSPVIAEFGYKWDQDSYYNPSSKTKGVLFSTDNPPSKKIVEDLKAIVHKFNS